MYCKTNELKHGTIFFFLSFAVESDHCTTDMLIFSFFCLFFFPISKSNNYDTSEVINVSRVSVVREEGRKEGGGLWLALQRVVVVVFW